jgi:predicted transcriptional regulator
MMKSATHTPNVRLSPHAHKLLRQLAEEEDDSMQAVLDKAIERYRREKFLRDANADFAALKRNRRAWKEELKERELWEHTLSDGLVEE